MGPTDVKQTIAISSTDTLQKYVGTTATDIGVAKIKAIQAQSSAANGSVKIYDAADATTASTLVFEAKWGTADNTEISIKVPGEGIYCDTGMYADLTNCDFLVVTGTFT